MDLDDQYRWLDRTLVVSYYTNWHPDDPGHRMENYMGIRIRFNGLWGDYAVTKSFRYICELGLI